MKRLIVYSLLFIVSGFCPLFADDDTVGFPEFAIQISDNWLSDGNGVDFGDFAVFAESFDGCKNCPCCLAYMSAYIHMQMICELYDPSVVYTGSPELQSDGFYYGYLHSASGDYAVVGVQFCWDFLGNGQSATYGWGDISVVNRACQCTGINFGNQYPHCLFDLTETELTVDEYPDPLTLFCKYIISLFKIKELSV
jgi:hypothetical protein